MEGVACGLAGPNEAYLDIIEWLVRSGADAAQRTPHSSQGMLREDHIVSTWKDIHTNI